MSLQHHDETTPGETLAATAPRGVTRLVPTQSPGEHDDLPDVRPDVRPDVAPGTTAETPGTTPDLQPKVHPADSPAGRLAALPAKAEWTAPRPGRFVAAGLLLVALSGTFALGWRYYGSGTPSDLTALVVGLAVVVVLWGLTVIASPQVVTVRCAVLPVFSGRDEARYDLADLHQRVDLTGEPGSASWALVLHRRDGSARVLRSADVDAVALDTLVRDHRDRAAQRAADRERRFTL